MNSKNASDFSFDEFMAREEDLINNPETRVPIILCVDRSYSMSVNLRLKKTADGIRNFCKDMEADPIARDAVELCIISYGGTKAVIEHDFSSPRNTLNHFPALIPEGETPLLDAVCLARETLQKRLDQYADSEINYFRPWIIFIGDGDQTHDSGNLDAEARWLSQESDKKALNVMCVVVGSQNSLQYNTLIALSPNHQVQYLQDLNFSDFFSWLSRSVQKNSQSLEGEELHYESTSSWAIVLGQRSGT